MFRLFLFLKFFGSHLIFLIFCRSENLKDLLLKVLTDVCFPQIFLVLDFDDCPLRLYFHVLFRISLNSLCFCMVSAWCCDSFYLCLLQRWQCSNLARCDKGEICQQFF